MYFTLVIYLCWALYYKFKCSLIRLILLSTEDGRWTTETCLVNLDSNVSSFLLKSEKVSRIRSNIIWNRWNSEGKTYMSEPASGNGNVNTVHFVNQARGNTRISRTGFGLYDWMSTDISDVYLDLSFLLRIMFVKKYTLTN